MSERSEHELKRFPIRGRMQYRIWGERLWQEGTTVSISTKEVVFDADEEMQPGTRMDIKVMMPCHTPSGATTLVACHAEVLSSTPSSPPSITARISAPRIQRR